ncbi:hypothetical protein B566_EDAN004715 [Ephemera danica]|nr:hypothetical protein B566_EDAN004715 [Ephemera danica]
MIEECIKNNFHFCDRRILVYSGRYNLCKKKMLLLKVTYIVIVTVTLALLILITVYLYRRCNMCFTSWRMSRYLKSPTHSQIHFSRMESAAEASYILTNLPELEWDSDEELLKV